jgi:hypothetical protein
MIQAMVNGISGYVDLDDCVDGVYTVYLSNNTVYFAERHELSLSASDAPSIALTLNGCAVTATKAIHKLDGIEADRLLTMANATGFTLRARKFLRGFGVTLPRSFNKGAIACALSDFSRFAIYA